MLYILSKHTAGPWGVLFIISGGIQNGEPTIYSGFVFVTSIHNPKSTIIININI